MNMKELLNQRQVTSEVDVPIFEMFNKSKDDFEKYLSKLICGTEELKIIDYFAINAKADTVTLNVSCDTSIFQENYKKRKMSPQERLDLLVTTIYKNLEKETNPVTYNTLLRTLEIIGDIHPNYSYR